jgi:DNA-directed RNA polymerase subunit L
LDELKQSIEQNQVEITQSDNTLENCYDVTLINEDYTIGNILNHELYKIFYTDLKFINYVGFKKIHPHDTDSILRISLINKSQGVSSIETMLIATIEEAIKTIKGIKGCFDGTRKNC